MQLSENVLKIIKFYDNLDDYSIKNRLDMIIRLDMYFMQFIEEVAEFSLDMYNPIKSKEELIDVLAYSLTIQTIMSEILKKENKLEFKDEVLEFEQLKENFHFILQEWLLKLISNIIKCRRFFPERKWHKKHDNISEEKTINDLKKSYFLVKENTAIIYIIAEIFYHLTPTECNNMVIEKQNYIMANTNK